MTKAFFISLVALFGLFSGLAAQSAALPHQQPDVTTVTDLNIQSFMGRWFMMYASKTPLNTFLKNAFCVVQDNKLLAPQGLINGMIGGDVIPNEVKFKSVISFNQNSATGPLKQLNGIATNNIFASQPGQFVFDFNTMQDSFYILALGDIDTPSSGFIKDKPISQPGFGGLRGGQGRGHPHHPKPKPAAFETLEDPPTDKDNQGGTTINVPPLPQIPEIPQLPNSGSVSGSVSGSTAGNGQQPPAPGQQPPAGSNAGSTAGSSAGSSAGSNPGVVPPQSPTIPPAQPAQPNQPAQPAQPVNPTQPGQSVPPAAPAQPQQPAQPVIPQQPPQQPPQEQPKPQPAEPAQPSPPVQPAPPQQPPQEQPKPQPAEPAQPSPPEQPAPPQQPPQEQPKPEPAQPPQDQPQQPVQPAQPVTPPQSPPATGTGSGGAVAVGSGTGTATSGAPNQPPPALVAMKILSQYPWAIVSDALGQNLFILARDVTAFQKYETVVLQKVQSLGFTSEETKPIKIDQGMQCQYPPMMMA